MNLYLKSLGCRLNEAELENWAAAFQARGHALVEKSTTADVIILNTCAVTREAVKKSRQLIRKSHRYNPRAKLVVSGCYASLGPDLGKDLTEIDLLVPNQNKDRLAEIVQEKLMPETMSVMATGPGVDALYQRGRHRAFIKIQDGCRNRCTFCIVTIARGRERSRSVPEIIDQLNRVHEQGIMEAVLTGVHAGGYGRDIDSDLYSLIHVILKETEIPRLRLASVEPWDLPDEFLELFDNERMMPHLHLPLQSGSDFVLRAMARRCKTADYARLVSRARAAIPDFNVTTDIIVGFPGETDREWRRGREFIASMGFGNIHIFPYSARAGTKAASLPDQIDPVTKKQRCLQLAELSRQMKRAYLLQQVGNNKQVLIESTQHSAETHRNQCVGYTPEYNRVQVEVMPDNSIFNKIKEVTILSMNKTEDGLSARLSGTLEGGRDLPSLG